MGLGAVGLRHRGGHAALRQAELAPDPEDRARSAKPGAAKDKSGIERARPAPTMMILPVVICSTRAFEAEFAERSIIRCVPRLAGNLGLYLDGAGHRVQRPGTFSSVIFFM